MGGDGSGERLHVIMVPLPAQSHLNSLLHFSRVIAQRGATVWFVSTSTHIHQVRSRVEGLELSNLDIRFQELPMPHFSVEELDSDQSPPMFPFHLIPLFEVLEDQQGPHLDRVLRTAICSENNKRVVVVYDAAMGWVQTLATKYSIPAYVFRPTGSYSNLWLKRTVEDDIRGNGLLDRWFPRRFINKWKQRKSLLEPAKGYIVNTFDALESEFIDQAREESVYGGKLVWCVGPLLPQAFFNPQRRLGVQADTPECMRWLDTQSPASVLYVSFGSTSCFSAAQLRELADGLERSGQAFLWVLRFSDGAHSSTKSQFDSACKFLEEGYERRLEGRGLIVRNWAPQLDILFHKSTGGFLTHCGWNSTLESISAGVGMLAWPLHSDQFANSALITRELKAGIEVKEWGQSGEENEEVSAEEVEEGVKRLMASEEGRRVRKRAQELRGDAEKAVGDGGSSCKDLDSLLQHFSQSLRD